MKFMLISSFLPSVLNFRGELLKSIFKQGYEIHIVAPNIDLFPKEIEKLRLLFNCSIHSVRMQRTGMNFLVDIRTLFEIYKILRKVKPDYVLSYTIKPVIYGTLAAYFAKVQKRFALITGLGYFFQNIIDNTSKRTNLQKAIHWLYRQSLVKASKVFFQNSDDLLLFQQLDLLKDFNKNEVPSVVINGSGVDTTTFNIVDLPTELSGEIKVSFLLIARLLDNKGVREYIKAAELIKKNYPKIEFNLVGWIDESPAAIKQNELDFWIETKIVKYWGKLFDVRPAITASSVYVLPSYREGIPRTVLEAMAMGRAIITTNAPGCRETVIDKKNGFLVEVKSVESLKNAMMKFIMDPSLIIAMGNNSRKLVLDKYDVSKVNLHMLNEMGIGTNDKTFL